MEAEDGRGGEQRLGTTRGRRHGSRLDTEVQRDEKLEEEWQGQEARGTSRKKTAGRRMSSRQRLGPAGRSTRNGRRSSSA